MTPADAPTVHRPHHDHAVDALLRRRAALPPGHPDRYHLRRRAVEASLPAAANLARRYANRGEPLADLQQVACVGLLKAVDGFDPDLATEFWAYATPTIVGEIKRYFRDNTWAVHVPRRFKNLHQDVSRCRDELIQRLRRLPRVADYAEHLGLGQEEIRQAMVAANGRAPTSLAPQRRREHGGRPDRAGAHEPGYDLIELHESIHPALARLSSREQRIILMRFFGNMTQSEIAAEVGLSQMHVSRLITRSLQRLRTSLRDAYQSA